MASWYEPSTSLGIAYKNSQQNWIGSLSFGLLKTSNNRGKFIGTAY